MALANVIFQIGSKLGPGGLASLQSGIQMAMELGRVVADNVKVLNDFSEQYGKLTIDISAADKASGGLIDTLTMIKKTNQVTASGLKLTSKQLENVSKFAADFAQKAGTDATKEFTKLMTAIQKGRTFTLKEFGIEVSEGGDRLQAFGDVMEQVTAQAEELNDVIAKTNSEALFALQNNVETTAGLLWDKFMGSKGMVEAAEGYNNTLGNLNETMMDQDSAANDLLFSWQNLAAGYIDGLTGFFTAFSPFMDGTQLQSKLWADAVAQDRKKVADAQWENIRLERELAEILNEFSGGPITEHIPLPGEPKGPAKPKRRRGGGRRRQEKPSDMMFTDEEAGLFTDEQLMAGFGVLSPEQLAGLDLQSELEQNQLNRQAERIDLRSTEISQQMQMMDIEAQMQELSRAGVDIGGLQSDFGMLATEENNEIKEAKLDLIGQELSLLQEMNAEKIQGLESQIEKEKELTEVQKFGKEINTKGFTIMGRTAGAYFDSVISGTAFSAEAAKNMIADLSKQESTYYAIQAIVKTGEGIFAAATGNGVLAAAAFTSAGKYAAGATAFGILAASLGGGGGAQAAPSASVPGASGPALDVGSSGPSVGGGTAGDGQTNVTVVLQGDSGRLFEVIQEENDNRRLHSLSTIEGDR